MHCNACVGDYGGPVYAYKLDAKGAIDPKTQEVVCTLAGSPNVRKNAPCLDGHIVICTAAAGVTTLPVTSPNGWINSIVTGITSPP